MFIAALLCLQGPAYSVKNNVDNPNPTYASIPSDKERTDINPNDSVFRHPGREWLLPLRIQKALEDGTFNGEADLNILFFDSYTEGQQKLTQIISDSQGDPIQLKKGLNAYIESFKSDQASMELAEEEATPDHEVCVALAFVGGEEPLLKLKKVPQILNGKELVLTAKSFKEEQKRAEGVLNHWAIQEFYKNNESDVVNNVQPCSCCDIDFEKAHLTPIEECVPFSGSWEKEGVCNMQAGAPHFKDRELIERVVMEQYDLWKKARYDHLKKEVLEDRKVDIVVNAHSYGNDTSDNTGLHFLDTPLLLLNAAPNENVLRYSHNLEIDSMMRDLPANGFLVSGLGVSSFFPHLSQDMKKRIIQIPLAWPFKIDVEPEPLYGNSYTTPRLGANLALLHQYALNAGGKGISPQLISRSLEFFLPKVIETTKDGTRFCVQREGDGKIYPEEFSFSRKGILAQISGGDLEKYNALWDNQWLLTDVFRAQEQKSVPVSEWDKNWTAEDEGGFFNSPDQYLFFSRDAHKKEGALEWISDWSGRVHDLCVQNYREEKFELVDVAPVGDLEPAHIRVTSSLKRNGIAVLCPFPMTSVYKISSSNSMMAYKMTRDEGVKKYVFDEQNSDLKKRSEREDSHFTISFHAMFEYNALCTREEFIKRNQWCFSRATDEEKRVIFQDIDKELFNHFLNSYEEDQQKEVVEKAIVLNAMMHRSILNMDTLLDLALEKEVPLLGGSDLKEQAIKKVLEDNREQEEEEKEEKGNTKIANKNPKDDTGD